MKISIHRALSELKMLDKRIDKLINNLNPTGISSPKNMVDGVPKSEFMAAVTSDYNSIRSLISRRLSIKSAIVHSNATTEVIVAKNTMTVAEAITKKVYIETEKLLALQLTRSYNKMSQLVENANMEVERRALELAKTALGNPNVTIDDKTAASVIEPYVKSNEVHIVDPLDTKKLVGAIEEDVDSFLSEVDAILSESNATTFIEV